MSRSAIGQWQSAVIRRIRFIFRCLGFYPRSSVDFLIRLYRPRRRLRRSSRSVLSFLLPFYRRALRCLHNIILISYDKRNRRPGPIIGLSRLLHRRMDRLRILRKKRCGRLSVFLNYPKMPNITRNRRRAIPKGVKSRPLFKRARTAGLCAAAGKNKRNRTCPAGFADSSAGSSFGVVCRAGNPSAV